MNSSFFLSVPYGFATPAGSVKYDNRAARPIVKELAPSPRPATLWPVEAAEANGALVERIDDAIRRRAATPDEIRFQALPFGTAIPVTP